MRIKKGKARLFHFLKQDIVQHLSFGASVFVIVFCFVAIHSWYEGRQHILESLDYKREAFWLVFMNALAYTLSMSLPIYFNLNLIYKGRIQHFLKNKIISEAQLKGWGFYIFLLFSSFTALFFAIIYAQIFPLFLSLIRQEWYELVIVILFLILCTTGVSFTKETIEKNRYLERKERQDAIREQREVERKLDYIKKQIRPHFLFNTLANLQILARNKSENVPDLIGELSRLLRHLVYETDKKFVPLEEETEFIESYVKLQSLQLGRNTDLEFDVKGAIYPHHEIAPMILLLFVENCFKHYNRKGKGEKLISILINVTEASMELITRNTFKKNASNEDNFSDKKKGGVGMISALENLKLIYQESFSLKTSIDGNIFELRLKIPIQ